MSQDPPHDPAHDQPLDRPAPAPAEDPNAPIPLEPREDTPPTTRPRIDSPGLLEDFDEDADFDSDPELERVVKGIPVGGTGKPTKHPTAKPVDTPTGEPICTQAAWRVPAVVGAILALTAAIFAGTYAQADQRVAVLVLITLYWAILHAATGVGAIVVSAILLGRPAGQIESAAARMLIAVSLFLIVFSLDVPMPGWSFLWPVPAAAAYFGGLLACFRLSPRDAAVVGGAHFGFALLLGLGTLLSGWVDVGTPG